MFERNKKDQDDTDVTSGSATDSSGWKSDSTTSSQASGRSGIAVIGRSIRIDGDLTGDEDLRIEGDVKGTVQLKNNTLTIGGEGKISANVYAKSVTVEGLMEGDIFGSECVNIRKNATVDGNITAPRVSLEDGAKFKGSIEMDPAAIEKALGVKAGAASGAGTMSNTAKISSQSNADMHRQKSSAAAPKGEAKAKSLN